jgi:hypothetical protein
MRSLVRSAFFVTAIACSGTTSDTHNAAGKAAKTNDALLRWWYTCGMASCSPGDYRDHPMIPRCGVESVGAQCFTPGALCDPVDDCNAFMVCSETDPKETTYCPISRMSYKKDIHFLVMNELQSYRDLLAALPLATCRREGKSEFLWGRADEDPVLCATFVLDPVDIYTYVSMAVAALQVQAHQMDELTKELAMLRAEIEAYHSTGSDGARARSRKWE